MNSRPYVDRYTLPVVARTERLIAWIRLAVAAGAALALEVGPRVPRQLASSTERVVLVYLVYAVVALVVARPVAGSRLLRGFVVAIDVLTASTMMALSLDPVSISLVYFVFALFCATLRWQWRGTLWTAAALLVTFGTLGTYLAWAVRPGLELSLYLTRVLYLGIAAAFLTYMGWHEERRRAEIERLAAWPRTTARDLAGVVEQTLAHAAAILGAPKLVLIWERAEEAWIDVAVWTRDAFTLEREPPGDRDALAAKLGATGGVVLRGSDGDGVLAMPGRAEGTNALAEIVAREVTTIVELHFVEERLRLAAIGQERLKFARDLHDGVLQALTGARLQLQARAKDDPAVAPIEAALAQVQGELRAMIDGLRPFPRVDDAGGPLPDRLAALRRRFEIQWGLAVTLDIDDALADVPATLAAEIYLLVHEALVNVARHARARTARVRVAVSGGRAEIDVVDDGKGFDFVGKRTLAELLDRGPSSLAERIVALDGSLGVESGPSGARVEMTVPVRAQP
jgi:signal transduction histidine kinase